MRLQEAVYQKTVIENLDVQKDGHRVNILFKEVNVLAYFYIS
jgi:hypothetical protein